MGQHIVSGPRRRPIIYVPTTPAWLLAPYADPAACWGCGLEPEVFAPPSQPKGYGFRAWALCFYCADLRALILGDRFVPPSASMNPQATVAPSFTDLHYDPNLVGPA